MCQKDARHNLWHIWRTGSLWYNLAHEKMAILDWGAGQHFLSILRPPKIGLGEFLAIAPVRKLLVDSARCDGVLCCSLGSSLALALLAQTYQGY